MRTQSEFADHLKHCIQEEHGINLSDKAVKDIRKTIEGAYSAAMKGAVQKQKAAENRYYEQKYITEKLIDKIGGR
ncbi:hypothetical protein [Peribacillus frigoritolerans]|uniref:hypothetical protein n=1 Tax=Peribacillus frigoritolerans TaxID=450367 RepID=UPI0030180DD5